MVCPAQRFCCLRCREVLQQAGIVDWASSSVYLDTVIFQYSVYSCKSSIFTTGEGIIKEDKIYTNSRVNKVAKGQYMPAGTRLLRVPPSFSFNILIYHLVFIPSIILVADKEKRGGSDIWGIFTTTNNQKERGSRITLRIYLPLFARFICTETQMTYLLWLKVIATIGLKYLSKPERNT